MRGGNGSAGTGKRRASRAEREICLIYCGCLVMCGSLMRHQPRFRRGKAVTKHKHFFFIPFDLTTRCVYLTSTAFGSKQTNSLGGVNAAFSPAAVKAAHICRLFALLCLLVLD